MLLHRRIGVLMLVILAVASLAYGLGEEKVGIADDFTGADWKQWDQVRKYYYVWGFRSGQNSAANTVMHTLDVSFYSEKGKTIQRRIGIPASIGQIVMGIDTVYSDYRNQNLPLWEVCGYVIDSIGGFKNESYIQILRKTYNKVRD